MKQNTRRRKDHTRFMNKKNNRKKAEVFRDFKSAAANDREPPEEPEGAD